MLYLGNLKSLLGINWDALSQFCIVLHTLARVSQALCFERNRNHFDDSNKVERGEIDSYRVARGLAFGSFCDGETRAV